MRGQKWNNICFRKIAKDDLYELAREADKVLTF